jgi:plastocyanin
MNTRLLVCGLGCLALAGCGSSSSSSSSTPATAPSGNTVTINMQNIQFVPSTQTVRVGQTVTWADRDTVQHDVKADSGASFHSPVFGKGQTYSFKATKPGTVKYECTLHPGMDGTLTVVAR